VYVFPEEKVFHTKINIRAFYSCSDAKLKATYSNAKKECKKSGLELASMGSPKEQNSINDYLKYIGVSSDVVFTALDALTDGKNPFANWGTGDPPGGPGECPSLFDGAMYNSSCDTKAHYACEGNAKK